jgi:hypothetical protein
MDIPQDIIDNVIAAVGDDTRVLKQCTLVSFSFFHPSRKQLFSRIILRNDQTSQGIHHFLVENPVIQSYVRSITLTDDNDSQEAWRNPKWMNGKSLLAILRLPFCCLECFSIDVHPYWAPNSYNWNDDFSSDLKDALSNVIHSSILKIISLKGITNVPITVFLHIVHLTTLELHSILPFEFSDQSSSSQTQAASKGVTPMASDAVIDQCIWSFGRRKQALYDNWYEIPFISFFFSLIQDGEGHTRGSRYSCHSCAVYASLKSALVSQPYMT